MFAVPGWKIAARSLVQEQPKPVREKSAQQKADSVLSREDQAAANLRKRKRNPGPQNQGPNTRSEPQEHASNEIVAASSKKKRKAQYHEHAAQSSNFTQYGRKNSGAKAKTANFTGANAEPVGPIGARSFEDISELQQPTRKQNKQRSTNRAHDSSNPSKVLRKSESVAHNVEAPSLPPRLPPPSKLTPLQAKMRAKLTSARFRHLNETLYTTSSADALALFTNSPDLFAEYHAGFSQQVKDSWPQNPVNVYIKNVESRGSWSTPVNAAAALPRRKSGTCTIADLGCGDAPLARGLQSVTRRLNLKLHNFDLHAPNSLVTIADISALPLRDGEVDIAIFCLSLMGINWLSFVEEAWRILRGDGKGEVWVAKVKSRFGRLSAKTGAGKVVENSVGRRRKPQAGRKHQPDDGSNDNSAFVEDEREAEKPGTDDDTDLQPFIGSFQRRGFMLHEGSVDKSNKMFVSMVFTKTGVPKAGKWKGMKWNGKEYQRIDDRAGVQQKNFQGGYRRFTDSDEIDEKEEGRLLKPCVYKSR